MKRIQIVFLAVIACTASVALGQTPLAHWRFDEGAIDSSTVTVFDNVSSTTSNWANADNTNGFAWSSAGRVGGALSLAGISGGGISPDYFDIAPLGLEGAVAATWTAWINPSAGQESGYTGVFVTREIEDGTGGTTENYGIAWENEGDGFGHVDVRVSGLAVDSGSLAADEWYHVALVWDSDDENFNANPFRELYVNGQSVGADFNGIPFSINTEGGWRIGQDYCCSNRDFRGLVDDLAVFDVALTASEIDGIYQDGLNNIDAQGVAGPVFQPGDVNLDGTIDTSDYDIINMNMFTSGIRTDGDLTGDNFVGYEDFAQWKNAFDALVIPEPAGFIPLMLAGILALGGLRNRR